MTSIYYPYSGLVDCRFVDHVHTDDVQAQETKTPQTALKVCPNDVQRPRELR